MKALVISLFLAGALLAGQAQDQAARPAPPAAALNQVQAVQLSIPFGVVQGRLVNAGQYLIFIDDDAVQNSFAVNRADISDMAASNDTLTMKLSRPVQDRAGQQSNLTFRFTDPAGAQVASTWAGQPGGRTQPRTDETADAQAGVMSFDARHNQRIGSDSGRLMITPTGVNYESVTEVNSSRRWNYGDIKEIKRDGPYKLKIVPFTGTEYNFNLSQGMDPSQYDALVKRVTGARLRN
jgi:hypothetical protein